MSRFDEIPQMNLDYSKSWEELTADAADSYFKVSSFSIQEVARAEKLKVIAIFAWFMLGISAFSIATILLSEQC